MGAKVCGASHLIGEVVGGVLTRGIPTAGEDRHRALLSQRALFSQRGVLERAQKLQGRFTLRGHSTAHCSPSPF